MSFILNRSLYKQAYIFIKISFIPDSLNVHLFLYHVYYVNYIYTFIHCQRFHQSINEDIKGEQGRGGTKSTT